MANHSGEKWIEVYQKAPTELEHAKMRGQINTCASVVRKHQQRSARQGILTLVPHQARSSLGWTNRVRSGGIEFLSLLNALSTSPKLPSKKAFARAMAATPRSERSVSEFGRFPQREQKRQYRNENEYNRRLTVHQCLRWDPVMAKKYQKQLKGFNTVKTVRAPQTSHLFSRTETGKRSV